jgi:hypothetical protein
MGFLLAPPVKSILFGQTVGMIIAFLIGCILMFYYAGDKSLPGALWQTPMQIAAVVILLHSYLYMVLGMVL